LETFKTAFIQRLRQKIRPFLTVLDVETGIGYVENSNKLIATPFLDDIDSDKNDTSFTKKENIHMTSMVLEKLKAYLSMNKQAIKIFSDDFLHFEFDLRGISDTMTKVIDTIFEEIILIKAPTLFKKEKKDRNMLGIYFSDLNRGYLNKLINQAFRYNQRFQEVFGYQFLRSHSLSLKKNCNLI
jgi:hypothetical protein